MANVNSEISISAKEKLTWEEYLETLRLYNNGEIQRAFELYNKLKHKKIPKGSTLYDWAIILREDILNYGSPFDCSKKTLSGMH